MESQHCPRRTSQPPFFTAFVWSVGNKDSDIIGVRRELRSDTTNKKDSTQGRIYRPIPKPAE